MKALIIIDLQRDFMPGGPLAAPEGDTLVPLINLLMKTFPLVVATKDWHPVNHISFAVNHEGKEEGEWVDVNGFSQNLWPVHCIQHTEGSNFATGLNEEKIDAIFYKGTDSRIDSYSAFFDNAKKRNTGLDDYLRKKKVDALTLVGVATEYCVLESALDARALDWETTLIQDACKPINLHPSDEETALNTMQEAGVTIALAEEVLF